MDRNGAKECPINYFGVFLVHVRQIGFVDFIVTKITLLRREPKPNLRVKCNIYFLGTMCAFVCT